MAPKATTRTTRSKAPGRISNLPNAVVIRRGQAIAARATTEPKLSKHLTLAQMRETIDVLLPGSIETKDLPGVEHVTLSAKQPWVEEKGYLMAFGHALQTFIPPNPEIAFVLVNPSEPGQLEIWLEGLEAGGFYAMQIRVGCIAYGAGSFHIGSSEGAAFDVAAAPPFQTIPILLPEVEAGGSLGMALITLEGNNLGSWSFYDAIVHRLG